MKSIFKGTVNGKVFDTKEDMVKFIQECLENDVNIFETSSYTETRFSDCYDCSKVIDKSLEPWPDAYASVTDYLIPRLEETAFNGDNNDENILNDTNEKLNNRLVYFNRNIDKLSDEQVHALIKQGKAKMRWCDKIIKDLYKQIQQTQQELNKMNSIRTAYDDLGGYVSYIVDTLTEEEN